MKQQTNKYRGHEPIIDFSSADRNEGPGIFFVVSGPSGVGKNTLLNFALKEVSGIYYLPSLTTRPLRPTESQGNPYFFVSVDEFEAMIKEQVFLEWKKIHDGNYYGTHLPTIIYALNNGFDLATDMDVLGCQDVRKKFPESVISIFIAPPSIEELRKRLSKRDNNPELTNTRLARVEMEMAHMPNYHYVVVNDNLQRAGTELADIFRHHRLNRQDYQSKRVDNR